MPSVVYELTVLGHGLERPMIELGSWGLNFQARWSDVAGLGCCRWRTGCA